MAAVLTATASAVEMVMVAAPVMKTALARRPVRVVDASRLLPLGLAIIFSMEVVLSNNGCG